MPGADSFAAGMGLNPDVDYLPPGLGGFYKEPFEYTVTFLAAFAAQVSNQTNINNDSFFVCTQQMADIWDNATHNTTAIQPNVAPATVVIIDTSSGKQNMDGPVALGAMFGTGSQPFIYFQRARVFRPGGQLQVVLTPRFTAAQDVRLVFHGFKVYPATQDDLSALS